MDAFDQLPDLCLRKIFAFLNLRDLIKCRAVNRQFKYYADLANVDELVVQRGTSSCKGSFQSRCRNWYLTDRPIEFENSVSANAFASLKSSPLKLDQLKFLHVHLPSASVDFAILNGLKQLVHLEIKSEKEIGASRQLNLPNLRVLDVRAFEHGSYVLKTPKLEVLACENIARVQVEHPEAIKRLECQYRGDVHHLMRFKNLESLDCRCIGCDLDGVDLSGWANLKVLDLSVAMECYDEENYPEFRDSLVAIIRQRAALKRDELKLYLKDVLLTDEKQLPLDYEIMDYPDAFWFLNHSQLRRDAYPSVNELQYDFLMELGVELSDDFFRRFPAIEYLTAKGPVDRDDFEWFLKRATALRSLTLKNTLLSQAAMENLPKICSELTNLEVQDSAGLVTDFNFVLQFKHLEVFETDRQLGSLDVVAKAFQQLEELAVFAFRAGKECVEIERISKPKYNLSFWTVSASDNKAGTLKLEQNDLEWSELATLYDQRRAAPPAGRKKAARIKRARLE